MCIFRLTRLLVSFTFLNISIQCHLKKCICKLPSNTVGPTTKLPSLLKISVAFGSFMKHHFTLSLKSLFTIIGSIKQMNAGKLIQ